MTSSERRILIALDMHSANRSGLAIPVSIARHLNATLTGIYIEDSELMTAAGLPFSTEINYLSAEEQVLKPEELLRINKMASARARRLLEELTEREQLAWTFAVESGAVAIRAMSDQGCDIFFPGRSRKRLIIEHHSTTPKQQLVLIYQGVGSFDRMLEVAHLLSINGMVSDITIVSETPLPAEVAEKLPVQGVRIHFQLTYTTGPQYLKQMRLPGTSLILMPKSGLETLTERQLSELLEQLPYPMMLVD